MLILVGVTINVALHGGLFTTTEEAASNTQIEAEKEQLLSSVIASMGNDAKVNFTKLDSNLPTSKWSGTSGTYTSPKGNIYTVAENGKIDYKENGTGESAWKDNGNGTFTKGDTTVEIGETKYTNAEVQEKLGATGGEYTGTWTVIGAEGNKLKLVSTENVGNNVTLGYNDPGAKIAIKVENENSLTDAEKLERCIWSYNNVVETLDKAVQDATGITSARSITLEDIEKLFEIKDTEKISDNEDYGKTYRYYYKDDETDTSIYSQYKDGDSWLPADGEKTNKTSFRSNNATVTRENSIVLTENYYGRNFGDDEYPFLTKGIYWIATMSIGVYTDSANFDIFNMGPGFFSAAKFFTTDGSDGPNTHDDFLGARAIIFY